MHNSLRRSKLKPGDVLVTKTGVYFGKSAVVPEYLPESNTIAHVARLVPRGVINPYYLSLFLNTSLGHYQLRRRGIKGTRPEIKLIEFQDILVPILPPDMQRISEADYRATEHARAQAQRLYTEAKALLLAELGLDALDLSHQPTYTQNYSQAGAAGRWDAEYFQPKYLEVLHWLAKGKHEALGKVAKLEKGAQARSESGDIPYASIKDIEGFIIETEEVTDADRVVFAEPDAVVLTVTGATIGKVAINAAKERIAICGDLVSIQPHRLSPHYLLAVLDSPMIQELCDRNTTGATNGHLAVSAVSSFPIPILPKEKENLISDKVKQAIHAHNMSKRLLEEAKQRVEEMVLGKE